jgi:Ca-activated chloride channel family protein
MLEATVEWNQPCRSQFGAATLYLGVRIQPRAAEDAQPVHIVVLLDVSTSMDGVKLDNAKKAVKAVWEQLGPGDRLSLLTFSTRVTHRFDWAEKGRANEATVNTSIDDCVVEGVTLLGDGLHEAIRMSLRADTKGPRFIWLITDGDPTNAQGKRIVKPASLDSYLKLAAEAASQGLTVGALGLGDASHYRFQFLRDLADKGQGELCYSPDPQELATKLAVQLKAAKAVTATQGRIEVSLDQGAEVIAAARVSPDYMPLDLPEVRGTWTLPVGPISTPETVVVFEVAHTALGDKSGEVDLGQVTVSANIRGERYTAPPVLVKLEFAPPGSRKIFARNKTMENMRVALLIARNAQIRSNADDLGAKARATDEMAELVRATGDLRRASQLEAEAKQLRKGQRLSADQEARAEVDGRATGPILLRAFRSGLKAEG